MLQINPLSDPLSDSAPAPVLPVLINLARTATEANKDILLITPPLLIPPIPELPNLNQLPPPRLGHLFNLPRIRHLRLKRLLSLSSRFWNYLLPSVLWMKGSNSFPPSLNLTNIVLPKLSKLFFRSITALQPANHTIPGITTNNKMTPTKL